MNKSVLISIRPKWCELIANGKKTVEVRKTAPKLETPFKCYIYETRVGGNIIGDFVCDSIDVYEYTYTDGVDIDDDTLLETMLDRKKINIYAKGQPLYGWHISDLKIYDNPKKLGEFKKAGYMTEEQWLYALYPNTHCHYAAWVKKFEITSLPQSWCYVEELL